MPIGLKPGVKPPFIALPHGGPIGVRDDKGFDYLSQFLAAQGYAALTAAFQKPDDFKCIISIAGISDLEGLAFRETRGRGVLQESIVKQIGDPDDDLVNKELKTVSAINQLHRIKSPILLVHGENDTQVHYEQSENFYKSAKKANINVEYIDFKYGTHYLDEEQNRIDAFKEIERFLSEHLN